MDVRAVRRRLDRATLIRMGQAAFAAGAAWELAQLIPGHGQPLFAPIAANSGCRRSHTRPTRSRSRLSEASTNAEQRFGRLPRCQR